MSALRSEHREILARLQSGRLMICEGQGDQNSDGCGGQGYTGASGQEACRHCFGVGVMTPDLQRAITPGATRMFPRNEVAQLIMSICDDILEYQVGIGICNTGTLAYRIADIISDNCIVCRNECNSDQQMRPAAWIFEWKDACGVWHLRTRLSRPSEGYEYYEVRNIRRLYEPPTHPDREAKSGGTADV